MSTDSLGNLLTLRDAASLGAVNDFVEGLVACEARAANILAAAADPSPIVQAYAAALHMFAESAQSVTNARPFIERALAGAARVTQREQRFVHAVAAWVEGDMARAVQLHEEQAHEHPRDLASLKLGHYHLFNQGDSPGMLRMALAALPAAADVPYLHGMLAFAWEQCHALTEAEAAARQAISMRRKEPWAHHALAHVMLTQGRIREGHDFLQDVSDTWTGLNSFMVTHNWWHQALFAIELDRGDEALALYDHQVWGVAKDYTQDQVNAVSLLARLELAGVDVDNRWQNLGHYLAARTADQVLPFLDLHYLLGLARAGRPEADALMRNIERRALSAASPAAANNSVIPERAAFPEPPTFPYDAVIPKSPVIPAQAGIQPTPHPLTPWQDVCLPAANGLLAWARGDHARACAHLGQALPRMVEIGGSHAQRDLFSQIHLDALIRSGHLAGAQNLLQPQLRAQPESARLRRLASGLYRTLGLGAVTDRFL